jgi:hypothetical protein
VDGILYNKDQTALICYPAGRTGTVTIPNSVTSINQGAFGGCSGLTSITIPSNVTTIQLGAFNLCTNLETINVNPANTAYSSIDGILYNKDQTTLICYPAGRAGTITIPNSVSVIGYSAFEDSKLISITIPNSVTSIEGYAFYHCNSLTSITIPNSVTSIGWNAFMYCNMLKSITIPNSVTSIGYNAFFETGLKSIISLNLTPPIFEPMSQGFATASCTLYVPATAIAAYRAADGWKEFQNIKDVSEYVSVAFRDRSALTRAVSSMPQITVRGRTLTVKQQSSSAPVQVRLLDLRGKTVSSFRVGNDAVGAFTLSNVPAGRYLVEVRRSGVRLGTTAVLVR